VIDDSGSATEPKTERAEEPATRKGMIVTQRSNEKSQTRHSTPPNRANLSEVDWQRFAADYTHAGKWIPKAIERLKNGDVSPTQHGIRVRVREDWGECGWEGAAAFWPKKNVHGEWSCACEELSAFGMCSHVLAARMYRAWLADCQSVRAKAW
jgi:hypothetical protein